MRLLIFLAFSLLFVPFFSQGSADIEYSWNAVSIEANNVSVRLERNTEGKLTTFELSEDGKRVSVDKDWYSDLQNPILQTLRITGGCSREPNGKSGNELRCSSHVSFNLGPTEDDFGPELDLPDWYEETQVSFYITRGELDKRLIKHKESAKRWVLDWLSADGNRRQGEIKSYDY